VSEKNALELHTLSPAAGAVKHNRKRRGQGEGSGLGRTAGRGHKGQLSRSGYSRKRGFEGGQMPLVRRLPKRGFTNIFRTEYAVVNLERLEALGVEEITPELLVEKKVVRDMKDGVKILGGGELTKALKVKVHAVTKSAEEKIKKAGGSVEIIERKKAAKPEKKKAKAAEKKQSEE
jgi:large subunit ribosomal protein L15